MIGKRGVTVFARVIHAAALELDGDDVGWSVIVGATGLRVEMNAAYLRRI
jgi:hypothetical protein